MATSEKFSIKVRASLTIAATLLFSLLFIVIVYGIQSSNSHNDGSVKPLTGELVASEPLYFLLVGSDSRKHTALYTGNPNDHAQTDQHADIITLMRVDPTEFTITLLSIPRDTVLSGENTKINNGLEEKDAKHIVDSVEKLIDIDIPYYLMTDYEAFVEFIDSFGGLNLDVPRKITVTDPLKAKDVTLNPGDNQHLDGTQVLTLARARKEYGDNQDALRQVNVREIEKAIIDKALNSSNLNDVAKLLTSLKNNTYSNFNLEDFGFLLTNFINNKDDIQVFSTTGPYEGGENEHGLWVIQEDEQAWKEIGLMLRAGINPEDKLVSPSF